MMFNQISFLKFHTERSSNSVAKSQVILGLKELVGNGLEKALAVGDLGGTAGTPTQRSQVAPPEGQRNTDWVGAIGKRLILKCTSILTSLDYSLPIVSWLHGRAETHRNSVLLCLCVCICVCMFVPQAFCLCLMLAVDVIMQYNQILQPEESPPPPPQLSGPGSCLWSAKLLLSSSPLERWGK